MSFNLSRYAQIPTHDITPSLIDATRDVTNTVQNDESAPEIKSDDIVNAVPDDDRRDLLSQAENVALWQQLQKQILNDPKYRQTREALLSHPSVQRLVENLNANNITAVQDELTDAGIAGSAEMLPSSREVRVDMNTLKGYIDRLNSVLQAEIKNTTQRAQQPQFVNRPISTASKFNLLEYKTAQLIDQQNIVQSPVSIFPVSSLGDFIDKTLEPLLGWNGKKGQEDSAANHVISEIQRAVGGSFEQEVNSALQEIQQLDPILERERAEEILMFIYEKWLTPMAKGPNSVQEQNINMAQEKDSKTIHLSHQVLNNQTGFVKTAADQYGQQYMLYGPTEKRICPKLRGKNLGDVVSEYTCRHHCLDGIVIDDNKTICGEALWRANAMDKFSREYVNDNGETVGGYLNKRFEINRNVPEENKMRLKPGELRKPRPASWGNTESRLQEMRNKEGQKRDYRPDTNTGEPFDWAKDQDQNNVQVSQTEKDRREKASGNQLIQYNNKTQTENNPEKQAFNLKEFKKTAQFGSELRSPPEYEHELDDVINRQRSSSFMNLLRQINRTTTSDELNALCDSITKTVRDHDEFRDLMNAIKIREQALGIRTAQSIPDIIPDDGWADGGAPYTDEEMDIMHTRCPECGGEPKLLGDLGQTRHFRCRQCGMEFNKPVDNPPMEHHASGKITFAKLLEQVRNASSEAEFGLLIELAERVMTLPAQKIYFRQALDRRRAELQAQSQNTYNLTNASATSTVKTAQLTGPRGPVGPDNPRSDDLGLSPDYIPDDGDYDMPSLPEKEGVPLSPDEFKLLIGENDETGEFIESPLYQSFFARLRKELPECDVEWSQGFDGSGTIDVFYQRGSNVGLPDIESVVSYTIDEFIKLRNADKPNHPDINLTQSFNLNSYKIAKKKRKGVTYEGEHYDVNPWAICNKSTGGKKEDPEKFERCVKKVKHQSKSMKKANIDAETTDHNSEIDDIYDEPVAEDVIFENWEGPFYQVEGGEIARNVEELHKWYVTGQFRPNIWWQSDHGNNHLTSWKKVFSGHSFRYNVAPSVVFRDSQGPFMDFNGKVIARTVRDLENWYQKGYFRGKIFHNQNGNFTPTTYNAVFKNNRPLKAMQMPSSMETPTEAGFNLYNYKSAESSALERLRQKKKVNSTPLHHRLDDNSPQSAVDVHMVFQLPEEFLDDFNHDIDALHRFLESLNDDEKDMVRNSPHINLLRQLRRAVHDDVNNTCKDLAIE